MQFSNEAKVLDAQELREMMERNAINPTIGRLVFVEQMAVDNAAGKVFPCFLEAWTEDDTDNGPYKEDGSSWLTFRCKIVHCNEDGFGIIEVFIHERDLGIKRRFWDKPPTNVLMSSKSFGNGLMQ